MSIKITVTEDNRAAIKSPYNPDFVSRIKKMGGKWDRSNKVWTVDERDIDAVRAVMREIYGMDDMPADLVSVRVKVLSDVDSYRAPVTMFGRTIATAFGRDSGARLGDGVVFTTGNATSSGSMKNWYTTIETDSEIILHDIPRAAVDSGIDVPEGIEYEIIESPANGRREKLEKEKACLLARLAEIEKELDSL